MDDVTPEPSYSPPVLWTAPPAPVAEQLPTPMATPMARQQRAAGRRQVTLVAGLTLGAAVVTAAAVGVAMHGGGVVSGTGLAVGVPSVDRQRVPSTPYGSGGSGSGSSSSSGTSQSTGTATATESVGIVDINTVLGYQRASAAGTGMIVTSSGEVLTNNHVVQGATSIKVTVVSTGRSYTATVVGTDASDDVAVLQLSGASGLATARFGSASGLSVGATVTGVGNAGGAGGTPSSATGQVVALDQQLTASDETGSNAETLTGMIETSAPIAAGDSGGPLYDASDHIVGMDTAAETNGRTTLAAYAIPIDTALRIARQIESGQASSTVHIGTTGFLGVSVADTASGAAVEQVVAGEPAARAGIAVGDTITAVGSTAVTSTQTLHTALATTHAGDRVTLTWRDANGVTHHGTVTLAAAPAA
jgi:S1-C subfamily serine protease